MSFIRMAAIAAAATILATTTAPAGPINPPRLQISNPDMQIEQVRLQRHHRRHGGGAFPAAVFGAILGGALNNGCYFNDCGYGYGYDYGGGGWGGGGRGHGGGGWGGGGRGHGGGHGGHGGHHR